MILNIFRNTFKGTLLAVSLGMVVVSCTEHIDESDLYTFTGEMMVDHFENNPETFSSYLQVLGMVHPSKRSKSTMKELLDARGHYTCFAPTNKAIEEYMDSMLTIGKVSSKDLAQLPDSVAEDIVFNSIIDNQIEEAYATTDFQPGALQRTNMNGRYVDISYSNDSVTGISLIYVNTNSLIITKDIEVENGYIHAIDKVLSPSTATVADLVETTPNTTIFGHFLKTTGWDLKLLEYKDKEYDLISGIIKTIEEKFILVDIKNTIGILLKSEQIPNEVYHEGNTIKCIIKEVSKNSKGSQVVLSRADAIFVKRLFEREVPEIAQGLVEIKAIAREAGERTKMAVYSRNDDVDAIGACIGPRGSRVQAVIGEIKGEKIDVFEWNDDIGELVKNALAPAEVKACFYANQLTDPDLTEEQIAEYEKYNKRPLCVVVDDDKLSIAIGKRGKNAKLAVKLTNRKIDIKTQSEIDELGLDVDELVEQFRQDQVRIAKEKEQKKFLELQEEAARRKAEFEEELAANDTGFDETTIEEMDETQVEEVVDIPKENLAETVKEDVKPEPEKQPEPEKEEEEVKPVEKPKKEPRKPLTPKTEYKSKFEDFADASKKEEEKTTVRRRKKKDDEDRRVRAEDLEKREYDEKFKPVYSDEELEEIEAQEAEEMENSWINDDDIDFDEYEDYYEEN